MVELCMEIISISSDNVKINIEEQPEGYIISTISNSEWNTYYEIAISKEQYPEIWDSFIKGIMIYSSTNNYSDENGNTLSIGGDQFDCYISVGFISTIQDIKVNKNTKMGNIISTIYKSMRSKENENRPKKIIF